MNIDRDLILKLENLARLELSEEERTRLQGDLGEILNMVEKLKELDTDNVEPLIHISEELNVLRKDEVKNQVSRADALKNAPEKTDKYFKVPKVIDIGN